MVKFAKWFLLLLLLLTALFLIILFLPYLCLFLLKIHSALYSKTDIKPADFLNFIAIMSTGILSVSISVMAVIISKKADLRDGINNQIKINTAKKIISFHIERSCQTFYSISEKQKASCDIGTPPDFEYHIEFLVANHKINKDDSDLIKLINVYVQKLTYASTQEEIFVQADTACEHFIDQEAKNNKLYKTIDTIESVLKKLQVENYA